MNQATNADVCHPRRTRHALDRCAGGRFTRRTPGKLIGVASIVSVLGVSIVLTAGCSSKRTDEVYNDPAADVRYYQRIVEEQPENADAQRALDRAERRLADEYAAESRLAMQSGALKEGLRLATKAASYDDRYIGMREEAGRRIAREYLIDADRRLLEYEFEEARALAQQAHEYAPEYAPVESMIIRVNEEQMRFLRELATEYLEDGDYRSAREAINRALAIDERDADNVLLSERIDERSRADTFQQSLAEAERLLNAGRLDEAQRVLERAGSIDATDFTYQDLLDQFHAQQQESAQLVEEADALMDAGKFEEARQRLLRARELNVAADVDVLLAEARGGAARARMLAAMDAGDPNEALRAARETLDYVRDDETRQLLPQLEEAVVQGALRDANQAIADDEVARARVILKDALTLVDSEQLRERLNEIEQRP